MGEARAKRRRHDAMLAAHPMCIYCGGIVPATTVEHMPPIMMFDQRQRPKGLEFPTCRECNHGTSHADLVASIMGRMYPDAVTDAAQEEAKKLFNAIGNNIPGLLEEMNVDDAGQTRARSLIPNMPREAAVLRADGPIMTKYMRMFGAKLGLALHFEALGSAVPLEGGVQPMYFTNVNAARGELPMELIELLPEPMTLQQGIKNVRDQFQYSFLVTKERQHSVFYAVFRGSFAIAAVTALDRNNFLSRNAEQYPVTIPGDFKKQENGRAKTA